MNNEQQDLLDDEESDEEDSTEENAAPSTRQRPSFYWQQERENLFTDAGLRLFEVAYSHKDEEYETARQAIDAAYQQLSQRLGGQDAARHGGTFGTYINFLEEMGLMYRESADDKVYLRATPAGDQAAVLLKDLPGPLRIIPYFVAELLSRYRLNNPLSKSPRGTAPGEEIAKSDIFPYWSLYKIVRSTGNRITKDELARFVFRTKRMADISQTVTTILQYRKDRQAGMTDDQIDEKYSKPLKGTFGQTKYIMGRAGSQRNLARNDLNIIEQEQNEFRLNPLYLPFIDRLLATEPQFEDLDENSWVKEYGAPIPATEIEYIPFAAADDEPLTSLLDDDHPVYVEVRRLLEEDKFAGVILIGPPGTGKTWYARQIGIKLAGGVRSHLREVQFHPSYQYEDFVEGYVPDGKGGFKLVDRHLLIMCEGARRSEETFVLIIDELSRTDPARVMGEVMTYMESSLRGVSFYLPSGRAAVIPPNLLFLATMNPEDRSVDEIDAAMDRRWGKVYLPPSVDVLSRFLTDNAFPNELRQPIFDFFTWVQGRYKLGHAFFRTVKDQASLTRLWDNQLVFLFEKAFRYDPDTLQEIQGQWGQMLNQMAKSEVPPLDSPPPG